MNTKQRCFAEYYAASGNAAEAARLAGYSAKTARFQGTRMLSNVDVQKYICELQEEAAKSRIASAEEVKAFWSRVMFDEEETIAARLKASELLMKASGAFTAFSLNIAAKSSDSKESNNDVVIYIPQKLTEEECTWHDDEPDGNAVIYLPEIESEESCKPKYKNREQ